MGYSDIVSGGFKSDDRWILHADAEQSWEDSFRAGSPIEALEWLASMCSHVPNKGEQADFAIVAYGYDGWNGSLLRLL